MNEHEGIAPKQILVADDDPAILRLVTAIVEKEGFDVVTARDGKEAYQLLQKDNGFEAAIFDVVMPYIQGTELVRFMQSERKLKDIPVIMMTAEQNPRLSSDSFAAGAIAFLPKPFTTSQLKVMLQMFLQKRKSVESDAPKEV
ncbi:MAG: response regulator [Pyrinomonadaceae bacterium]|nr:response regulator [Pyrinomonadaceae bacterium]